MAKVSVGQALAPPPPQGAAPQDAAAAAAAAGAAAPVEAPRTVRLRSCCSCGKVRGGAAGGRKKGGRPGPKSGARVPAMLEPGELWNGAGSAKGKGELGVPGPSLQEG